MDLEDGGKPICSQRTYMPWVSFEGAAHCKGQCKSVHGVLMTVSLMIEQASLRDNLQVFCYTLSWSLA